MIWHVASRSWEVITVSERIATREAYGYAVVVLGKHNERIVVLEADISKSTRTDLFAKAFPGRYLNVGIGEQNEMGIAAGLATCGLIPFVSTYSVFASMRACEQLRTSVAYPRLNVKVAVSHGGITPGSDGVTHQATEDIGIVRTIPNMTVIMPADAVMTRKAVFAMADYDGPVYLRLTRNEVPVIYDEGAEFEIGKAVTVRDGGDLAIIALGDMLWHSLKAADILAAEGIGAKVIDMHTVKPLDVEAVLEAAETGAIVTVEDHNYMNGLGSAVAEVLVENNPLPMLRIGLRDTFAESGPYEDLLSKYCMDADAIAAAGRSVLRRSKVG
jgi:transketolase